MHIERQTRKENFFRKKQIKLLKAYAKGKLKKAEKLRSGLLAANTHFVNKSGFK